MFCASLSLLTTNVTVGPLWLVLIMISGYPSAITIRELWKNKGLFLIGPGIYTAHMGPQSKVMGRRREFKAWGSAFIGVEIRALASSLSLVNFKCKSESIKLRKRKTKMTQKVSYWSQPRLLKQRCLSAGDSGLALHLVGGWQCVYLR